jgi:hypothetical protein
MSRIYLVPWRSRSHQIKMIKTNKKQFGFNILVTATRPSIISMGIVAPIQKKRYFSTDVTKVMDKQSFILTCWEIDFPNHADLSYDKIASLASRSAKIGVWFREKGEEFVQINDAPTWFTDAAEDAKDWNREFRQKLDSAKLLSKKLASDSNDIAKKSKVLLKTANENYKNEMIALFKAHPELLIHFVSSQILPFETHIKAMEFESELDSKQFIADELASKKDLLISRTQKWEYLYH